MHIKQIEADLSSVTYKDWHWSVGAMDDGSYLQVRFTANGEPWSGRKWYVSRHATRSEVIQTALKAVLTAEEHEAREQFLYCGKAIFGPHLSVDKLLSIADHTEHRK